MRVIPFLMIGTIVLVSTPQQAGAQSDRPRFGGSREGDSGGGSREGDSGRRSFGMMGGDPTRLFDMMSRGKDVISRNDVDPMFQGMFDRFAERMGITNGQMSRQQFTAYMQQRMAEGSRGGPPGGGTP